MKFEEKFGIKNLGIYKSFTAVHSYKEWAELHNINLEKEITDIDSLLKEAKHLFGKLLNVYDNS